MVISLPLKTAFYWFSPGSLNLLPRTFSLPRGDVTPCRLTSTCSQPSPRPPPPPNVYLQQEEVMVAPSGRGTEGKLPPQEGMSDNSAVFMWVFFFGGRREAAGKRDWKEGKEGGAGSQAPCQPGQEEGGKQLCSKQQEQQQQNNSWKFTLFPSSPSPPFFPPKI